MMDLKMEVYTPGLELLGFLEIQRSVIWTEKAFSAGSFSIESLITDESLALLRPENIVWIEGDTAGIIEYIQEETGKDGPYITVKGYTLTGILDRRILWGLYSLKGTASAIMHYLVDDCCINPTRGDVEARKIPGLALLDPPAGGGTIQFQKTGGTLLESLEQLGEAYGVAFGVRFNPAVPRMEFWTRWGQNRSVHQTTNEPVFYSTELDDVLSSEYSYNSQDYRNVALVAGEGEGSDRAYVTVEGEIQETPDTPVTPPAPDEPTKYTVTLSIDPAGGGTASGGKTVAAGVSITVTATPSDGYEFAGWSENGAIVSTSASYTFTVTGDRALTAVFAAIIPTYTITVSIDPAGSGTVTGAGQYKEGESVTIKAVPGDGYDFTAWQENGVQVSVSAEYTFTATADRAFVAVFEEAAKYVAGVDWFPMTMPSAANWYSVAYGNGKFVAIAYTGTSAAYSTNGVSWTATTLPASASWISVTYGNGTFVAIAGSASSKAAYSTDGINWTGSTLPSALNWFSVTYGNGKFVAVSSAGTSRSAYSTDGKTWTAAKPPTTCSYYSVAYGNGRFVAVGKPSSTTSTNAASYSTDGINWTAAALPLYAEWRSITYGNGVFVAVASATAGTTIAAYSTNGINWVSATLPTSANWYSVTYGDSKFVAVAYGSNNAAYSEDGKTWSTAKLPTTANWRSVTYGDDKFVAVSTTSSTAAAYSSANGPEA